MLALLQEIRSHGLDIQAINGNLHVRPRHLITDSIRQSIRAQKAALVDFIEAYEELAVIMEYDTGLSRQESEAATFPDLTRPDIQSEIIRQVFADYEDETKFEIPW